MSSVGDHTAMRHAKGETPSVWFARLLAARRPLVMGVLNLTPDSFSDGGKFVDPERAIAHAQAMIAQGAAMVNDVWGLQRDPGIAAVVAEHRTPVVIMHNRDAADPSIDIMTDIEAFFARSLALAEQAGIARDRIVLDPGIGFGKTPLQSIEAIAQVRRLARFSLPLLVGASRKRF